MADRAFGPESCEDLSRYGRDQRHIPRILATIQWQIAEAAAPETIRARLRELLPTSYGPDTGWLASRWTKSRMCKGLA